MGFMKILSWSRQVGWLRHRGAMSNIPSAWAAHNGNALLCVVFGRLRGDDGGCCIAHWMVFS